MLFVTLNGSGEGCKNYREMTQPPDPPWKNLSSLHPPVLTGWRGEGREGKGRGWDGIGEGIRPYLKLNPKMISPYT